MEVVLTNDGYVSSYNLTAETASIGGEIVEEPDDMQDFEVHFYCYKVEDGKLKKDSEKFEQYKILNLQTEIRARRERECFSIIDRSLFWYEGLSDEQNYELRQWYEAWLDAPETFKIPEKPEWL